MKGDKSQDPPHELAGWRPKRASSSPGPKGLRSKRANGVLLVSGLADLRPRESWCFSLSLKAGKRLASAFESSRAGRTLSYLGDSHPLCSIQAFNWLDEAHPHQGGPFALLNLLTKRLHSSKNAVTETPRIMFNQISGFLVAQSDCPIKLNITW